MNNTVVFNNKSLSIINKNGKVWMTARQLGVGLGYSDDKTVQRIYTRHSDEFTDEMAGVVKLTTPKGGTQEARVFSPRGCHLIAMFARTPFAKEFRKWVLDVLEKLNQPFQSELGIIPVREHTRRPPSGKKEVVLSEKEHKAIGGIVKSCVQSVLKEVKPDLGLSGRERNLLDILRACGYDMKANDASWEDTFSGLDGFIIQGHYERMAIMAMRAAVAQEMLKTASEAEKPKYLAIRNENLKRIHRQSVVNEAGLHCIA